ncbi:hypothetical protein [Mangrovitalea sediminis]|uniref:hypothetical protein n=1 Tax=Mangrovitalea sediminis TaxID=1982043 RepID=UPI000BE4C9C2|nr:hypothetical protein [Mangrovitalea sediminis]
MGMPINGAAGSGATQQLQGANVWQQRKQSFDALSQALQTGNLNAAKQAFSSLSSTYPAGVTSDPKSFIARLGQALQTGNIQSTQSLIASLTGGGTAKAAGDGDGDGSARAAAAGNPGQNINVSV